MYNNNTENIRTIENIGIKFKELVTKLSCSDKFKCRINKIKEEYNNLDTKNITIETILKISKIQKKISEVDEDILKIIYKYLKDNKIILTQQLINDLLEVYQSNKLNYINEELNKKLREQNEIIKKLQEENTKLSVQLSDKNDKLYLANDLYDKYDQCNNGITTVANGINNKVI